MQKTNKITPDIIEKVKLLLEKGYDEASIRKTVRKELSLGKSQGNAVYNKIKESLSTESDYGLEFAANGKVYNANTDTYLVRLKSRQAPLVISGAKHRAICRAYTTLGENLTTAEICRKFSLTPEIFNEYRRVFNLVKEREPLSEEEVLFNTVDNSVESILEQKRYAINQSYEHESWKVIQAKADKWDDFQHRQLDVITNTLDGWIPPKTSKLTRPKQEGELIFAAGLMDCHIGELFDKTRAFSGEDFDSSIAADIINEYSAKIINTVNSRKDKFGRLLLFINGDYLNSTLEGRTRKGTQLHNDLVDEEMFELGLNILIKFIENVSTVFPNIDVYVQKGNHESVILSYLALAAEKYFKDTKWIKFHISKAWATFYRIGDIGFILTHGGNDTTRVAIPNTQAKLKSFVQELLLEKADQLAGVKTKLLISGHRHAFSQLDLGSFEFFCFGSSVKGDNWADLNNWRHSARQNAIILDDKHLLETLHYHF